MMSMPDSHELAIWEDVGDTYKLSCKLHSATILPANILPTHCPREIRWHCTVNSTQATHPGSAPPPCSPAGVMGSSTRETSSSETDPGQVSSNCAVSPPLWLVTQVTTERRPQLLAALMKAAKSYAAYIFFVLSRANRR
jgi:hypothetical protein